MEINMAAKKVKQPEAVEWGFSWVERTVAHSELSLVAWRGAPEVGEKVAQKGLAWVG